MTTRASLNNEILAKLRVKFPPLPEQKAIANILGRLDDKIALNRRMNQTLENMAQALFKSWFVDFDPVIDNALLSGTEIPEALKIKVEKRLKIKESQGLKHDDRFPDSFVYDEELGRYIPEGWEVRKLGDELDVIETGRRPKGGVSKFTEGIPSIGAESIKGVGNFDFSKLKFVPEEFFEKMKAGKVASKDVLLYKDGGKPGDFKPRIGMFGEGFPFDVFGINEHVFRLRSESLGQPYLYYQISSKVNFTKLSVMGGKAAIPGVNQQEVKSLEFLIPSKKVLDTFNSALDVQLTAALKRSNQTKTLTKLRDTLLPHLISGKLKVPAALVEVEKARLESNSNV